jgi:hypothetical protein
MFVRLLVRPIVSALVVLIVLAALVVAGTTALLGSAVRAGIEAAGPVLLKAPVAVQDVDISLLGGSLVLRGLEVGNPEGFPSGQALLASRIEVEARLRSLLSDEIVLHRVEVQRPEISVQHADGRTNLAGVLDAVRGAGQGGKRMRIGVLSIRDPSVALSGLPLDQEIRLRLPDIELEDLSPGGEGRESRELLADVLTAVQEHILRAGASVLSREALAVLRGEGDAERDRGNVLDRAIDAIGDALEDVLGREDGE